MPGHVIQSPLIERTEGTGDNHIPSFIHEGERLRILLVFPDHAVARLLQKNLERIGSMTVDLASTGEEALDLARSRNFDTIVSDYDMPDMDGIELHRSLNEAEVMVPFILFTIPSDLIINAESPLDSASLQNHRSVDTIFIDLIQKIRQAVELYRTRNQLELYSKNLEKVIEQRTDELHKAQRFAVIGELATMIGHDMRNPLQVITNLNYLMKGIVSRLTPEEREILTKHEIVSIISKIGTESLYLNKIVSDLQDYASDITLNPKKITIEPFLTDIIKSMAIPDTITIRREYQNNLEIAIDPLIFKRVIENLIMNSVQAMQNKGVVVISAIKENEVVDILISDTGPGIPQNIQKRIFEPLFTTKPKGTGFGLAVSRRLMELHGGEIQLVKSDRNGTTFKLKFNEKVRKTGHDDNQ